MDSQFDYKGHSVRVNTYAIGSGYRWQYQIDMERTRDCEDRPLPDEALVLKEGEDAAKGVIDRRQAKGG